MSDLSSFANVFTSNFGLGIRKGLFSKLSGIDKFGYLPTATASYKTVWDGDNVYTYPTTAKTMNVISSAGATDDGINIFICLLYTSPSPRD